jgi:hypothetical protein
MRSERKHASHEAIKQNGSGAEFCLMFGVCGGIGTITPKTNNPNPEPEGSGKPALTSSTADTLVSYN